MSQENPPTAPQTSGSGESSPQTEPMPTENQSEEMLMEKLQADLDRFRDLALRSQADFENFRKRAARDKEDAVKYANLSLLEKLIPILDNFELGLLAARNSPEAANIVIGFDMVARQLNDFLSQAGIEPIQAEGQKFDPNLHEAVSQEPSPTVPEGNVIRQHRKGFKLKDRLIRPSAVVVSKGAA
jgi:molecular chaperone GrpE